MPLGRRGHGGVRFHYGTWVARIQIESQRRSRAFPSREEAEAWLTMMRGEIVRAKLTGSELQDPFKPLPQIPPKPIVTFGDLARLFVIQRSPDWKGDTLQYYQGFLRSPILPAWDLRDLASITTPELMMWLAAQRSRVSGVTCNKYRQVLTAVFRFGLAMEVIPRNPMLGIRKAKEEPRGARALHLHELRALLQAASPRARDIFLLLALTGLRRTELTRLHWDHVDWISGWILIQEGKTGAGKVPLSPVLHQVLERLGRARSGPVVVSRDGERPQLDIRTALEGALRRSGVDSARVSTHSFRHTFASLLARIPGVTLPALRALMRHSRSALGITGTYLHEEGRRLQEIARALGDMVVQGDGVILLGALRPGSGNLS